MPKVQTDTKRASATNRAYFIKYHHLTRDLTFRLVDLVRLGMGSQYQSTNTALIHATPPPRHPTAGLVS